MSALPAISNQRPFDGNTKEYAPIFKVGSALDNEDSVIKLETKPIPPSQQQPSPRTIITKTGMLKSQDISIQKFYEGLQNRKPGSSSHNRKVLKTPKITMELSKKANSTGIPKRNNNMEVDKIYHNIYSPSNSNIEVAELSEGHRESNQVEPLSQKQFDIATGEIKIDDQILSYTINEILGICLSMNFSIAATSQIWTVFVPTNKLTHELLRVCKLTLHSKEMERFCSTLLSCTTLEIKQSDGNGRIVNGNFATSTFQAYALAAINDIVNISAKIIQRVIREYALDRKQERELRGRRKVRQSQLAAASRAKEHLSFLRSQIVSGQLAAKMKSMAANNSIFEGRKISQRTNTSNPTMNDGVTAGNSISSNEKESKVTASTAQLAPTRPIQRKPPTHGNPPPRFQRASVRMPANGNTFRTLESEASNSMGIAASFTNTGFGSSGMPAAYYSSYSSNVANTLVNNLREDLSNTLSIFEDEIISMKQELEDQKASFFYSRGGARPIDVNYKSLENEFAEVKPNVGEELKQRLRSNAFKDGGLLHSSTSPRAAGKTITEDIAVSSSIDLSALKSDFEALQKKFQGLEMTLREQQETTALIEQKALEEIQYTKENTEILIQDMVLATKNEMIEKFQAQLYDKQKEMKILQEKVALVGKSNDEMIQKHVATKYQDLKKKLQEEYHEIVNKQDALRVEMTSMIEARQVQEQQILSHPGNHKKIATDPLDFNVHESAPSPVPSVSATKEIANRPFSGHSIGENNATKRMSRQVIKPYHNPLRESTIRKLDELSSNGAMLLAHLETDNNNNNNNNNNQIRPAQSTSSPSKSAISPFKFPFTGSKIHSKMVSKWLPTTPSSTDPSSSASKKVTDSLYSYFFAKPPIGKRTANGQQQQAQDLDEEEHDNGLPIHPTSARLHELISPPSNSILLATTIDGEPQHGHGTRASINRTMKDNTGAMKMKSTRNSEEHSSDQHHEKGQGGDENEDEHLEDIHEEYDDEHHGDDLDSIQMPLVTSPPAPPKPDPEKIRQEAAAKKICFWISYHHQLRNWLSYPTSSVLRLHAIMIFLPSPAGQYEEILMNALEVAAEHPKVIADHPLLALIVTKYASLIELYEKQNMLYPIDTTMFLLVWRKVVLYEDLVEKGLTIFIAIMKLKMKRLLAENGKRMILLLSCLQDIILQYKPIITANNSNSNSVTSAAAAAAGAGGTSKGNNKHAKKQKENKPKRSLLPFKIMKLLFKFTELIYHKLYIPYVNNNNHLGENMSSSRPSSSSDVQRPESKQSLRDTQDTTFYQVIYESIFTHSLFSYLIPLCFEQYAQAIPLQPVITTTNTNNNNTSSGESKKKAPPAKTVSMAFLVAIEENEREQITEIYAQSYEHVLKIVTILLAMSKLCPTTSRTMTGQLLNKHTDKHTMKDTIQHIWQAHHLIDYLQIHLFHHTHFTFPAMSSYLWTVQCLSNCLVSGQYQSYVTRGIYPHMYMKYLLVLQHTIHYQTMILALPYVHQTPHVGQPHAGSSPVAITSGSVWEKSIPPSIQRYVCQLIHPFLRYLMQLCYDHRENSVLLQSVGIVEIVEELIMKIDSLLVHRPLGHVVPSMHHTTGTEGVEETLTGPGSSVHGGSVHGGSVHGGNTLMEALHAQLHDVLKASLHLLSLLVLPTSFLTTSTITTAQAVNSDHIYEEKQPLPSTSAFTLQEQQQQHQVSKLIGSQQKILSILFKYYHRTTTNTTTTHHTTHTMEESNDTMTNNALTKEEMQEMMDRVYALQHQLPLPSILSASHEMVQTNHLMSLLSPTIVTTTIVAHTHH